MSQPRWAAVVVNYESGSHLLVCVRSLLADSSGGGPPEVVVVDHGSADGSVEELVEALPDVQVLRTANRGYAAGANQGIAATTAPIVAVCNPDVVVEPGAAATVLARFDAEPDLGAVGPMVRNLDGSPYHSARVVPTLPDTVGHGLLGLVRPDNPYTRRYRELDVDPSRPRDADWVSGAAVWLRRDALAAVGGWDDRYFMYVEDVDLCWRLRQAGWRVAYEPAAAVTHARGASTARHPYRMILEHHRSLARFAAKRWHGIRRLLLGPAVVFLAVRAALAMAVHALGLAGREGRTAGVSG
ncbi:MAG TPA: glycosyltransferase family 2 protein [Acidimicrobiia bacterium]